MKYLKTYEIFGLFKKKPIPVEKFNILSFGGGGFRAIVMDLLLPLTDKRFMIQFGRDRAFMGREGGKEVYDLLSFIKISINVDKVFYIDDVKEDLEFLISHIKDEAEVSHFDVQIEIEIGLGETKRETHTFHKLDEVPLDTKLAYIEIYLK